MKHVHAALALPLLLAACVTPAPERARSAGGDPDAGAGPGATAGKVAVLTDPPGATLTFVDGSTCQTPCEVTVPVPMTVLVARAGYKAVRADLAPGDGPRVTYALEPVGRSEPVEVFELDEGPEGEPGDLPGS